MPDALKKFIADHPFVTVIAMALAGYYGGAKGQAYLSGIAKALGLY